MQRGKDNEKSFAARTVKEWTSDVDVLIKCSYAQVEFRVACDAFCEAGHTMPVRTFKEIPCYMMAHTAANQISAETEHGLKETATKLKESVEKAKELMDRIRLSIVASVKALANVSASKVKKEKQQDKDRVKEERQKLNAAKEALKAVRALCKDKNSPGLLSYCGQVVSDIRKYKDINEFKTAAAAGDFDIRTPYLIEECKSLQDLAGQQITKMAFTNFRAQLPASEAAKQKKKAQCPYSLPNVDQVRSAMLELTPKSRIPFVHDSPVSQWGCMSDMMAAGLEHQAMGNLRFTMKGAREVACTHFDNVLKVAEGIMESRSKVLVINEKYTVNDMIESTLLRDMDDKGLSIAEECQMRAFRCTAPAGSLLFIPAGFATVERALGTEVVQGWRTAVIEGPNVLDRLSSVENKVKGYAKIEANPTLQGIDLVRQGIKAAAGKK